MKEAAFCEEAALALESVFWKLIPFCKSLPWGLKQITLPLFPCLERVDDGNFVGYL